MLSRLARDAQLVAYLQSDFGVTPAEARAGKEGSHWVVMARRPEYFGGLLQETQWMAALPSITGTAWTDDYLNVLGALVFTPDLSFKKES